MAKLWIGIVLALTVTGSFAAGKAHPMVMFQGDDGGVLVGGMWNGSWLSARRMAAKLHGGERYRLYSEMKPCGTASGSKAGKSDLSEPWVKIKSTGPAMVAVAGDWNALPRLAKSESTKQKVYLDAVHDVLVKKGLGDSPASVQEVLKVDLDGDGRDEVIIIAKSANYDPIRYIGGQYSFVMVRRLVGRQVSTTVLCGQFHSKEAAKDMPEYYEIDGMWDLDGDGVLEIPVTRCIQGADAAQTVFYDLTKAGVRVLGKVTTAS